MQPGSQKNYTFIYPQNHRQRLLGYILTRSSERVVSDYQNEVVYILFYDVLAVVCDCL